MATRGGDRPEHRACREYRAGGHDDREQPLGEAGYLTTASASGRPARGHPVGTADDDRNAILTLVRSAVSNDKAATMLREFLTAELLTVIARLTGHPDAHLRASLVAAQLIGIATLRHVIRVEPLVRASPDEIVPLVTPAIEQYLL
jgi:hypothetical protein